LLPIARTYLHGADKVGLWVGESLTAFGQIMLQRLRDTNPEGGAVIPDKGEDGVVFKIGQPGKQHYGIAQSYMRQFMAKVRRNPAPLKIFTALERKSEEDGGQPIYGP